MEKKPLSQDDVDRLREIYRREARPDPSDIGIIDGRILTFKTYQDRRASAVGLFTVADKHLAVDYDGNPATVEIGVTGPDTNCYAVVTLVQDKIWKDPT